MSPRPDPQREEDILHIDMGDPPKPQPMPIPETDEVWPVIERPQSAWDRPEIAGNVLSGPVDGWLGEVTSTFYDSETPPLGDEEAVYVRRAGVEWGDNHEPNAIAIGPDWSANLADTAVALPMIPRHDQATHVAAAGDIVTVIGGRDGRLYYFSDDLPWIGWVVDSDATGADNTEGWAGMAGLKTLTVRRYAMSGDPTTAAIKLAGPTLGNMLTAAGVTVDYSPVYPVGPNNQHHGYRVGDRVLVTRRGWYFYCTQAASAFPAKVTAAGPASEADFTDNRYWVREIDNTVAYSSNTYTLTQADRARAVATQTGFSARHVCAVNWGEAADSHEALVADDLVTVRIFADPATAEPYYVVERALATTSDIWARITGNSEADSPAQNRWEYTWVEVEKTTAGYGGWTTKAGGHDSDTDGVARNTIEDMNQNSLMETEGNGGEPYYWDTDDYTLYMMPCTTGNVVRMTPITFTVGEETITEYWFSYENGISGGCD